MHASIVNEKSLYSRLLTAEDDFLTALETDESSLTSFSRSWTSLQHDVQSAQSAGRLTQEVAELAYIVSTRISTIAEAFEEFDRVAQDLSTELSRDLDRLFGETHIPDGVEFRQKINKGVLGQNPNLRPGDSRSPSYIQSAYAWLLDNLHNPYPSKQIKESIAKRSGSPVKLIDGWFTDIRKRMGWSKMKRVYFQNKRKPLVDAATSFFRENGSLSVKLMDEFAEMEASAKGLYAGKFFESGMLSKVAPERSEQGIHQPQQVWPYPSPCQSPERVSPVPRHTEPPDTCLPSENVPAARITRKRSRSEDVFSSCSVPSRSSKRVR